MAYNSKITGLVISRLRLQRGLSQEVLSGLACRSRSHLAMIETGAQNPKVDTLYRLADALGISLSELFRQIVEECH